MRIVCKRCDHPVGSHNDSYGCEDVRINEGYKFLCSCAMTYRQLLEIDPETPPTNG